MTVVPGRSQGAAGQDADTHVNGASSPAAEPIAPGAPVSSPAAEPLAPAAPVSSDGALLPVLASDSAELTAAAAGGPDFKPDPGLYAVLGLDPSASDIQIQTTYRRRAAKLLGSGSRASQTLKQLNVAYEVLGNPVRRAEYDRLRLSPSLAPGLPTPVRSGARASARVGRRRRPRQIVQQRYAGLGDVLVVIMVVGLAILAGALLIPRLQINLSALNAVQSVLPLSNPERPAGATPQPTDVPTPEPTPTVEPTLASLYTGSTVSVTNPTPAQNTSETVQIQLRRGDQPAAGVDVWATVQYRTTQERWPATGTVQTDPTGKAAIVFNIGTATPSYPVAVRVFAQVEDQQLSWSTTFTPR